MNGCNNYRLISESSTATNDSLEARNYDVCKDSCFKLQASGRQLGTGSVFESTEDNKTSSNANYDLPSVISCAPFRELNQIFEKHRAELEKKKRLYKQDCFEDNSHNIGKSKTGKITVASAASNNRDTYLNGTDTTKQSVAISDMSEAFLYPNDHKKVSRKEDKLSSVDKSNSSTCHCFHLQNSNLNKSHEFEGQELSDVQEALEQSSIKIEEENMCQSPSARTAKPTENNSNFDATCPVNLLPGNLQHDRRNTQKEIFTDLKVRDEIISDYQLQEMMCHKAIKRKLDEEYEEIQKLRKNYLSLRKLFSALAILNIILILCVVSVMPVLLVTFKLSNEHNVLSEGDVTRISAKHLSSTEAENIVKEHVFCVECHRLKNSLSEFFTKGCCVKDFATFVERMLDFTKKERDSLLQKIENDNQRQNNEIFALQNVVLNTSFNGSEYGALLNDRSEKQSQLINTLLTRKRLAVHLSGTASGERLLWKQDISQGHSKVRHSSHHHIRHSSHHQINMIKIKNGGVYFVYSCIHFDVGSCNSESYIGYKILMKHGHEERTVASNHHSCVNGTNSEVVLTLHQMVNIPSGSDSTLRINIDSGHFSISAQRRHYFGLFEI